TPSTRGRARCGGDRDAAARPGRPPSPPAGARGARRAWCLVVGGGAAEVGTLRRARGRRHPRDTEAGARARECRCRFASLVRRRAATSCGTVRGVKPDEAHTVYEGSLLAVTLERWGNHEREIVEHPGAVAIVAVDREGMVNLVRQRREAARKRLLELPAGTLEEGETPIESARRELEEETGLRGGDWREVTTFFTTPGFCRERMHLFFAEELDQG